MGYVEVEANKEAMAVREMRKDKVMRASTDTANKEGAVMFNDHGAFATKRYFAPSKKARGFWHGDNPADKIQWGYALRSQCGTYWDVYNMVSGFDTEEDAIRAAQSKLGVAA